MGMNATVDTNASDVPLGIDSTDAFTIRWYSAIGVDNFVDTVPLEKL